MSSGEFFVIVGVLVAVAFGAFKHYGTPPNIKTEAELKAEREFNKAFAELKITVSELQKSIESRDSQIERLNAREAILTKTTKSLEATSEKANDLLGQSLSELRRSYETIKKEVSSESEKNRVFVKKVVRLALSRPIPIVVTNKNKRSKTVYNYKKNKDGSITRESLTEYEQVDDKKPPKKIRTSEMKRASL